MVIFDDVFVDQNIYSGLVVGSGHRQNLHELILGAQGVALNQELQRLVAQIEVHNRTLRLRDTAIPVAERGGLSVDEFCALPANANIEQEIQATERNLAASREQDPIRNTPVFDLLTLPPFDLATIERVLQAGLPDLDATAAARVQSHLATVGRGAEQWVAEGMRRQAERPAPETTFCVFCAQDLAGSPVINHYRAFFSQAYQGLKQSVNGLLANLDRVHGGNAAVTFERAIRLLGERRQFWSRFCELPQLEVDTVTVIRDWNAARDNLLVLLSEKQAAPLDPVVIPDNVRALIQTYEAHRTALTATNHHLQGANQTIAVNTRDPPLPPTAFSTRFLNTPPSSSTLTPLTILAKPLTLNLLHPSSFTVQYMGREECARLTCFYVSLLSWSTIPPVANGLMPELWLATLICHSIATINL